MDQQNQPKTDKSEDSKQVAIVDPTEKINKLEAQLTKMAEKVNKLETELAKKENDAIKMTEKMNKLEIESMKKELEALKAGKMDSSSSNGQQNNSASTIMTIRERTPAMVASNSASFTLFGTFLRSFGFGGVGGTNNNQSNNPNRVFVNWPEAMQNVTGSWQQNEGIRIFATLTPISKSAAGSSTDNDEEIKKPIQFLLEQDNAIEQRILSVPTHLLLWNEVEPGDEVIVQVNNDLNRGFLLPSISCTISRILIKIYLSDLSGVYKISFCADSLADYFLQTFKDDVLNVGQSCLLEFECATKNNIPKRGNGGHKIVEMGEQKMEKDLMALQPKNGLATFAAALGINKLLGWINIGGGEANISKKCKIKAKIFGLYRGETEAQFGIFKETTKILFYPFNESRLCLYGNPAIIRSFSDASNVPNATTTGTSQSTADEVNKNADNATNCKLIVQQFERNWRSLSDDDSFLVHQKNFNVVSKAMGENDDSSSSSTTNSYIEKGQIVLSYKVQEDTTEGGIGIKERQFVWTAINQSYYYHKGARGKIFITKEMMDELKIEPFDEVTIQALDESEKRTANLIKIEISQCDRSAKCPIIKDGIGIHSKNVFFHVNDIVDSLKKAFAGKIMNLDVTAYLNVEDGKRMKKFKTNLFDEEMNEEYMSCIKFRITEIQGTIKKQIDPADDANEASAEEPSTSSTAQNVVENLQYAAIKKDTIIEIKTIDPKLIIFGIEGQPIDSPKLFDQNGWNLHEKIGGLSKELGKIFQHAFLSRMIPANFNKEIGEEHIHGILLHGPPGTGKTLIARELAKILNSREPKVISGAEVQSMWHGQSERNVRSLFVDAEREQALAGDQSRLHVIIIDELDSLCPKRENSDNQTDKRIVNTLLAKLDGVEQLNNILIIGMTNFLDTIDPALLRPGRLELQIEIGLPNENGRQEILEIHTKTMRESNRLNEDVNLAELAKKTVNYSGAELKGLVRAAKSQAMKRIKEANEQQSGQQNGENSNESELKICAADFELAFENDIKPAFGKGSKDGDYLKQILRREPIHWSSKIEQLLKKGANLVDELRNSDASSTGQSRLLLLNGQKKSGKKFLATTIAQRAGIPYIRFVTADLMLESTNYEDKTPKGLIDQIISDCENTEFACIIFEKLEQIIGYGTYNGEKSWHAVTLRKLQIVFDQEQKKGKRLLFLVTSCEGPEWFEQIGMHSCLQNRIELPGIDKFDDVINFLAAATKQGKTMENVENEVAKKLFTKAELDAICKEIGPKFDSKIAPTVKDLVELTEWYSKQEATNAEEIMPSPTFDKFKERLIELIAQKKRCYAISNSATHLSMYR